MASDANAVEWEARRSACDAFARRRASRMNSPIFRLGGRLLALGAWLQSRETLAERAAWRAYVEADLRLRAKAKS